jgi:Tfp pilus assembly protein PilX
MSPCLQHRSRRPSDEEGIALITALLIMLLSTAVVAGILGLAIHTAQRSGLTRNKTAALNAAEAGIQAELSLISDGSCPNAATAETPLPNQALPTASYIIHASPAGTNCTVNGSAVISATGYVPNATNPVATITMVAHISRSAGAPTSSGGYDFPDALFAAGPEGSGTSTDGVLSDSGALNLYGTGGSIPNITADSISIIGSGSQLGGAVAGQVQPEGYSTNGTVSVAAAQIGGQVTGVNVALTGMTVEGGVAASGNLSLTNVTLNGAGTYGGTYIHSGGSGTVSSGSPVLPLGRPLGTFANTPGTQTAIASLGVGTGSPAAPTTSCPASATAWTANFYDIGGSCASGYNPGSYSPATSNGITVIVVRGTFNVTVPQSAVGGQLYVIDSGGGSSDSLTIAGSGSTLPVFAFTDGALHLSGTLVGQMAADNITAAPDTTMTFAPPAAAIPGIAFPPGYTAPTSLTTGSNPYIGTVSYEYQCPGTTAC